MTYIKKKLNHVIKVIPEKYWRYKCNFCGKLFKKASDCAKHIEKESFSGICFPTDILIVDSRSETLNASQTSLNREVIDNEINR